MTALNERTLLLFLGVAVAILLLLLLVVSVALLRTLRRNQPKAPKERRNRKRRTSDEPVLALPKGPDARDQAEEEIDITRMTPFAMVPKDALPKLSATDETEGSDDEPTHANESKALLHFEGNAWQGVDEPTGPIELIQTAAAAQTDRGITRRRNEDSYLVDPALGLYIIADGMGGYAGGEIASRLAVEEVRSALRDHVPVAGPSDKPRRGRELIAAVERANAIVWYESRKDKAFEGMGTTLIVGWFSLRKARVYIGHVGDSRCYRLRTGALKLLTSDHTLGARGVKGPFASNIRRAIGVASTVKVDLIIDKPGPDDVYLLCSDGLNKMVRDDDIRDILSKERDPTRAVASLILAANASGGRDNITVIVVRVRELAAGQRIMASGAATGTA